MGRNFEYPEDQARRGVEHGADEGGQGRGSPKGAKRLAASDEGVSRDLGQGRGEWPHCYNCVGRRGWVRWFVSIRSERPASREGFSCGRQDSKGRFQEDSSFFLRGAVLPVARRRGLAVRGRLLGEKKEPALPLSCPYSLQTNSFASCVFSEKRGAAHPCLVYAPACKRHPHHVVVHEAVLSLKRPCV